MQIFGYSVFVGSYDGCNKTFRNYKTKSREAQYFYNLFMPCHERKERNDKNMNSFITISKYAGMREDLVQAGGGNSSYKANSTEMYIKASGFQLADVAELDGYAVVNPKVIKEAFMNCTDLDSMTEENSKEILQSSFIEGKRPSIETFLHAISGKYTLHTHPIVVNAMTCRKGGMEMLETMFPDALIVPYATPGVELAKKYFKAYKKKAEKDGQIFDVVFLQNHGLVISADTAQEVIEKTERIVEKLETYLQIDMQSYHEATEIWKYFKNSVVWRVTDYNVINCFMQNNRMWNHTFCPDCIVFLGKNALKLTDDCKEYRIEKFQESFGQPVLVEYHSNLYIIADTVKKALETQSVLSFSVQVMKANEGFECNFLSDEEQNFLLNWDAEKYRKNMK